MFHFVIELKDGKHKIVACANGKAYAQQHIANIDPAARRTLFVVGVDEWF